ncbi:AtpZ/AtpI family protein [Nakamurella alba]|uniref:AtpZ/AtpI family protein n=1 Tax=Nakamurella alba TaxID=2665158 RepID=UPI001E5E12EB|nr:AtpZ/AtpI family protein [Nakamurella alba]
MKMRADGDSTSSGTNEGWAVMTTLIGGFVVWGGVGWLLDKWWDTRLFTPIGLVLGMALGIYAVVAKFGRPSGEKAGAAVPAQTSRRYTYRSSYPRSSSSQISYRPGPPPANPRREHA